MSIQRKVVLGAVLALVALMSTAALASASTGSISPGGNITSTSSGKFTFSSSAGRIACRVVLRGNLRTSATGTLSEEPAPEINPQVGSISSGEATECGSGNSANLLFPGGATWPIYNYAVAGTESSNYILNSQFDVTAFFFVRCLINARTDFTYNSSRNLATVTGITVLSLGRGCPSEPGLIGSFTLNTAQTFSLS